MSFWDVEVYACAEGIGGVIRDIDVTFKSKVEIWQSDRNPIFLDSLMIGSNDRPLRHYCFLPINPIHLAINPLRSSIIDLNHVDLRANNKQTFQPSSSAVCYPCCCCQDPRPTRTTTKIQDYDSQYTIIDNRHYGDAIEKLLPEWEGYIRLSSSLTSRRIQQSQQPSHTLRKLDKITKTVYIVMSLSPSKLFQRFKELFAGRSPNIAAAIREAEKRQPAAAFKPPVKTFIGSGGKELTQTYKVIDQYKDETGQCRRIVPLP
jgi:hypothetical protein